MICFIVLVLDRLGQTEWKVLSLEEPRQFLFQQMRNQIYKEPEPNGSGTQVFYNESVLVVG